MHGIVQNGVQESHPHGTILEPVLPNEATDSELAEAGRPVGKAPEPSAVLGLNCMLVSSHVKYIPVVGCCWCHLIQKDKFQW